MPFRRIWFGFDIQRVPGDSRPFMIELIPHKKGLVNPGLTPLEPARFTRVLDQQLKKAQAQAAQSTAPKAESEEKKTKTAVHDAHIVPEAQQ